MLVVPITVLLVPKTGDSLDIEAAGNGIRFNGGYGTLAQPLTPMATISQMATSPFQGQSAKALTPD